MAKLRQDPTRTTRIRQGYSAELSNSLKSVQKQVTQLVWRKDAFGLRPRSRDARSLLSNRFQFGTSAEKHAQFMEWLRQKNNEEVLRIMDFGGGREDVPVQSWWGSTYIRRGYRVAIDLASAAMRQAGIPVDDPAPLSQPIHAQTLSLLYSRNYSGLRGITQEMENQIGRVLTEGFANGLNPRSIASSITNRVSKVGIHRARMLARTEVINAHASATLNQYERFGISSVGAVVEFSTANNGVCPKCASLEGRIYTIEEARGVIPVHPNCRCTWLPVIDI